MIVRERNIIFSYSKYTFEFSYLSMVKKNFQMAIWISLAFHELTVQRCKQSNPLSSFLSLMVTLSFLFLSFSLHCQLFLFLFYFILCHQHCQVGDTNIQQKDKIYIKNSSCLNLKIHTQKKNSEIPYFKILTVCTAFLSGTSRISTSQINATVTTTKKKKTKTMPFFSPCHII